MRILIVEDDEILGSGVNQGLIQEGYSADWVEDVESAELAIDNHEYDLIVLDLGLPDGSGLDILKGLRKNKNCTPVIILTAFDTSQDKIVGLDSGADDYLTKPFDLGELFARVRALHRRSLGQASPIITYGSIELDPSGKTVSQDGKRIELGPKEFAILQTLLEQTGKVFNKTQLEDSLYGWNMEVESNTVEVHVHGLRKKLGKDLIKTIRGVGYIVEKLD